MNSALTIISFASHLQTECHVVDDGVVVCGGLVVHGPPAADELEPSLPHQPAHRRPHRRVLLAPPPPEERRLDVDEALGGVRHQGRDHRVDDVLHAGRLDAKRGGKIFGVGYRFCQLDSLTI